MRVGRKDYTGDQATKEPRDHATKEPRDQASKEPRDQATKEPRDQASNGPGYQGTKGSGRQEGGSIRGLAWFPGFLVPWICCEGLCPGLPGPLVPWFLGPLAWELGDQGPDGHQHRKGHHCDKAPNADDEDGLHDRRKTLHRIVHLALVELGHFVEDHVDG